MAIGGAFFIIAILIIAIWVIIEVKRLRHKMFAIFLIVLILLTYFSFVAVFKGQDPNLKTLPGIVDASKLYFSWLFSVFGNMKTITTNAIKMDWKATNDTGVKTLEDKFKE